MRDSSAPVDTQRGQRHHELHVVGESGAGIAADNEPAADLDPHTTVRPGGAVDGPAQLAGQARGVFIDGPVRAYPTLVAQIEIR